MNAIERAAMAFCNKLHFTREQERKWRCSSAGGLAREDWGKCWWRVATVAMGKLAEEGSCCWMDHAAGSHGGLLLCRRVTLVTRPLILIVGVKFFVVWLQCVLILAMCRTMKTCDGWMSERRGTTANYGQWIIRDFFQKCVVDSILQY